MGLAMAEVLGGFARVLKLRARRRAGIDGIDAVRIGWLTPLLGLFVIVDQSTFFLHIFTVRDTMPFNAATVLGILVTIGWYYLIAAMTFPDEPASWPDFDDWFWQQKRFVVGGVLGVNVLSTIAQIIFANPAEAQRFMACIDPVTSLAVSFLALTAFPMMIWLFFSRSERVCKVLILANIAVLVIYAFVSFTVLQPVKADDGEGFDCVLPEAMQEVT